MDFFGTGMMVVVLKHVGTTAVLREMLKMSVRTSASWSAHSLSTLPGILSGPGAFFGGSLRAEFSSRQRWTSTVPVRLEEVCFFLLLCSSVLQTEH